ncbi:primosomal replication protein N [Rodentibacter caecimuris]|uniref:Replication restart protein PriB n=1 Tax=Rodentibacter caecimuris TaxID=1796644 RepID=A0ABX3KYV0_9PAST|nr:primosomal replication protein N [Rodentibacter heylii]
MLKSNSKIDNRFSIIGIVYQVGKRNKSPSGIEHFQFWLKHRSEQKENNLLRSAQLEMAVQVSGNQLIEKTQGITVGSRLLVAGFITSHKSLNGLNQLVLHAEQIEFID